MSHPATDYSQLTSNDAGLLTLSFVCPFNYEKYVGIFNILKAYTGPSGAKVSWKQDTDIVSKDPRSQDHRPKDVFSISPRTGHQGHRARDERLTEIKGWRVKSRSSKSI